MKGGFLLSRGPGRSAQLLVEADALMVRGQSYFSFTARVIKNPTNLPWTWEFLNQEKIDFFCYRCSSSAVLLFSQEFAEGPREASVRKKVTLVPSGFIIYKSINLWIKPRR